MNNKIMFEYLGFTIVAKFYWHMRSLEIDSIDITIGGVDMYDKLSPEFRDEIESAAWDRGHAELTQHG